MGHQCFFIAGASDRPADRTVLIPEAHFAHPAIQEINRQCFGREVRHPATGTQIHEMARVLKNRIREALRQFDIDLIIAENCATIPMNIPLGLAVVETIMESGVSCIAHHHDFVSERERFFVNAVDDHLHAAFPPPLGQVQHVAINSRAAKEFSRRTGSPVASDTQLQGHVSMPDKPIKRRFIDVFNRSTGIVFAVILVFILFGIAIGVLRLFLEVSDLFVLKRVSGSYLPIISDVLTLFILIELSRSLIDYFDLHRLRLTFIIDAGIVFVLRELMIKMFENKVSVEEMFAISTVLFVLGALRLGSVFVFQREKQMLETLRNERQNDTG